MKILLFNDNPVVRKLVALSAQKNKDELNVIGSVDEIQESDYDLLIVDDALYSDETFESLKELVTYKSTLLMATRTKAVPSGFDNIINKPFLPTDLVDIFIKIDKKTASAAPQSVKIEEPRPSTEPLYAINLDEPLSVIREQSDLESFDLGDLDDELDLSDTLDIDDASNVLDDVDDTLSTAILDQEEVQEVQHLLDDTERDDWGAEEEIIIRGIDEPDVHKDPSAVEEEAFSLANEDFDEPSLMDDEPLEEVPSMETKDNEENTTAEAEEFLESLDDLDIELDDEVVLPNLYDDTPLDDEGLGDLETQIQEAIEGLGAETLDTELDEHEIAAVGDFGEFDELDMLDERELKLAIGEEVEDEPEIECEEDADDSLSEIEPLNDELEETIAFEEDDEPTQQSLTPSHAEGVEALQALLKALSNEEVAKSLKGLNISININFGNEQ